MTNDERIGAAIAGMDAAILSLKSAFDLFVDAIMGDEDGVDVENPVQKVPNEDPALCQHPENMLLVVLGQRLCHACGANLDE